MRIARAAVAAFVVAILVTLVSVAAMAADPVRKEGTWIARDFKFHTGEVMPELRLAYTTIGEPTGEPVLVLHGTTGSAASMLAPTFGGELFGAGQPLDASKHYIIIPDSIGHGKSSKPSMACAPNSRNTTMTTWWRHSIGCSRKDWTCAMSAW